MLQEPDFSSNRFWAYAAACRCRLARYPNLEVLAIFRSFGYFSMFLPFNRRYDIF